MPQAVASTIDRVTVFTDRAQVFRGAKVALDPGEHTLHFEGLWDEADRNTLQLAVADAPGANKALLQAVQFTTVHNTEDVRPLREAALQRLEAAKKAVRGAQDQMSVHDTAIESYKAVLAKMTSPMTTVTSSTGDVQPAVRYDLSKQKAMTQFCRDGVAEHTTKLRAVRKDRDRCLEEQQLAQAAIDALRGVGNERRTSHDVAEVKLSVSGDEDVTLNLTLSYVVRNASWEAVYDLRVDDDERTMQVTYAAMVKQATGEEWENVKLELSTAKPQASSAPPPLEPWHINFAQPVFYDGMLGGLSRSSGPPRHMMMQQMMMTNMMPERDLELNDDELEEEQEELCVDECVMEAPRVLAAAVTTGTTAMSFGIPLPVSLRSDNNPTRVTVTVLDLPVHFRYSCVPKLDPLVYLKVKATNTSPYQLLPGKASVFAGGQLLSRTEMDHVAPAEEFWTFLGTDADVRCTRTHVSTTEAKIGAWIGSDAVRHDVRFAFACSSTKAAPAELVVWDQYPVSDHKSVVITPALPTKDDKTTHGTSQEAGAAGAAADGAKAKKGKPVVLRHEINDHRFIEWFVELHPQTEVSWAFEYSAAHPAKSRISGGEGMGL